MKNNNQSKNRCLPYALICRKSIACLCFSLVLLTGCAPRRSGQENYALPGTNEAIFRALSHDNMGMPVLGSHIHERPSRPGEHFTVVRFKNGLPMISYDIVVTRQNPDFTKPFEAVYEWTGKGFTLGAKATGVMLQGAQGIRISNSDEGRAVLAIIAAPLAVGTVGGFIVGIADGVNHAVQELNRMVVPGEQVVTCTTYEYDDFSRLSIMRILSPDRTQEFVRTVYVYEGLETTPVRSEVKSLVENKERVIK